MCTSQVEHILFPSRSKIKNNALSKKEVLSNVILKYSEEIRNRFPLLSVLIEELGGLIVAKYSEELENFKKSVFQEVVNEYDIDGLKERPLFRAYRDFFWAIGIDPTKTRPSSEALIRRILQNGRIPLINTLVDAYNLASIKSGIPLAAFDKRKIEGELQMRFAKKDEKFLGIGMKMPIELNGNEIVITDSRKVIAVYPYRDSESTKVTENTEEIVLMICGVPGISEDFLENARKIAVEYIGRFCGKSIQRA